MDEGLLLPLGDFSNKNSDQVDGNFFVFFFLFLDVAFLAAESSA